MKAIKFTLVLVFSGVLIACGGGGSGSNEKSQTPEPITTPILQDALSQQLIQGEPVNIALTNTGQGGLESCTAPALPAGLTVTVSENLETCIITGDALTLLEATDIEVTATNANGSSQAILPLTIEQASPFILKVRATASESSGQRSFVIRHNPEFTYDYTVDWGDGSEIEASNGSEDLQHTYAGNNTNILTVTITGLFPQQSLTRTTLTRESIVSIEQWGNQPWKSLQGAFANVHNLVINATDLPNLKHTSTLAQMFQNAEGFNQDISQWDISNVTDMSAMFSGVTLSVEMYDSILNAWSNLPLQQNVSFDAGDSIFSVNAGAARAILTDNFLWQISDGGHSAAPQLTSSVNLIKTYTNLDAEFTFKHQGADISACESNGLPSGISVEPFAGTCKLIGIPDNETDAVQASVTAINEFGQSTLDFTIQVLAETPYVTRWKTDNEGETDNNSITIYTSNSDYNFTVEWGDGNINENVTTTIVHTYDNPGEYEVSITGRFPQPIFPNSNNTDAPKLLSVESWGQRPWLSMRGGFIRATNLEINPASTPDLSRVTDMANMFVQAIGFNSSIGHWDVSNVTKMASLFNNAKIFNQDISGWNMSNVTTIHLMFNYADEFNQPVGNWDTSSVTDMRSVFKSADKFNQPLENWDTSSATTMEELFDGAKSFNQPIGNWDTSSVKNMRKLFHAASAFNQDISDWDVSNVTNMEIMFKRAYVFNQDITTWDVSNVTNMDNMFERVNKFDQNLSTWDIRNVTGNSVLNHTFSTENYDDMLITWSNLGDLQEGVTLKAGDSQFSPSAAAARNILIDTFGWTINDGGVAPE